VDDDEIEEVSFRDLLNSMTIENQDLYTSLVDKVEPVMMKYDTFCIQNQENQTIYRREREVVALSNLNYVLTSKRGHDVTMNAQIMLRNMIKWGHLDIEQDDRMVPLPIGHNLLMYGPFKIRVKYNYQYMLSRGKLKKFYRRLISLGPVEVEKELIYARSEMNEYALHVENEHKGRQDECFECFGNCRGLLPYCYDPDYW